MIPSFALHPQCPGQRRRVELADVLADLASLQRVLVDDPWEQGEGNAAAQGGQ